MRLAAFNAELAMLVDRFPELGNGQMGICLFTAFAATAAAEKGCTLTLPELVKLALECSRSLVRSGLVLVEAPSNVAHVHSEPCALCAKPLQAPVVIDPTCEPVMGLVALSRFVEPDTGQPGPPRFWPACASCVEELATLLGPPPEGQV